MRNNNRHVSPAHSHVALAALSFAMVLASGCSGDFPVGDFGSRNALLDGSEATASESPSSTRADGIVPAALPEPDVSAEFSAGLMFGDVTSIGDLDGDGNDDLAITTRGLERDYVLVRYGGPRLATPEAAEAFVNDGARLALPNPSFLPASIAAAGDVDGDGFDDLLVAAATCDTTGSTGDTFLVYGGPERLEGTVPLAEVSAHFIAPDLSSEPDDGCAEQPAFSAGDLDGDGLADLVLPAPPPQGPNGFVFGRGEGLYVFYGRAERFSGDIPFAAGDARLAAPIVLDHLTSGDVNGDGLSDFLTGSFYVGDVPTGTIYVPGSADRWSGLVDLQTQAIPLDGAQMSQTSTNPHLADLDGDGLSDVTLLDDSQVEAPPAEGVGFQLFYGTPDLFADGIDFSQADAQLFAESSLGMALFTAGDRDGDDDDELMDHFALLDSTSVTSNIALVSGSRQRISGAQTVPEAEVAEQTGDRIQLDLFKTPVAADLDGDGASELITVTSLYDDEYIVTATLLNFHYGVLAPDTIASDLR